MCQMKILSRSLFSTIKGGESGMMLSKYMNIPYHKSSSQRKCTRSILPLPLKLSTKVPVPQQTKTVSNNSSRGFGDRYQVNWVKITCVSVFHFDSK